MRISDWSSDVCSSDLTAARASARSTRTWASADPPASNGVRHHSTRQGPLLQGGQRLVEGLARTHHRCGLGVVGGVVAADVDRRALHRQRSEEHTSELQSLMRLSYAVFCLKKKKIKSKHKPTHTN